MSQYPTDFGGGVGGMSRNNRLGLSTDTGGIRTNIGVQGLEPLPPGTQGMQIANELAQSLGLLGNLAGTIDQVQRRRQAAQDQEDAKVEQFDRGEAVRAAANTYAELEPAIRERKMIAAVDDKDLGGYVESLIQSRTDKSMAPAWKDEYQKQLHGRLLNAFGQQRAGIQKDAKETALRSLQDRAFGARQTVEIMDAVNAAKTTLGLSDMEAHAATTIPALRLAAEQGDRNKFEQAALVLPQGMFADEVTRGQTKLDATVQRSGLEKQRANEQEFSAWFNKDPQNLPPYEVAIERLQSADLTPADRDQWRRSLEAEQAKAISRERQTVEDMIGSALRAGEPDMARKIIEGGGKFGDEWKNAADQRVDSYQTKVVEGLSREYEARWQASVTDEVMQVSMRAYSDGTAGLALLPDKSEVTLPNGKTATVETKDAINAIRPQVFASFDKQFANQPQRALAEKTRWLSANGVIAPEWKQAMDAGAAAATEDALSDPKRAQTAIEGFNFYRQLSAQSPSLARQMVGEQARKLYDTADGLLAGSRSVVGGTGVAVDPSRALLDASRIINDPNYSRHEARADSQMDSAKSGQDSALVAAAKQLGGATPEVLDTLRREARPLIIGGKAPADALSTLVERYKATTVIVGGADNRRPINTQFEGFSDQFRAVIPSYAEVVLADFAATEGAAQGYKPSELSLSMDPRNGLFYIVDANGQLVRSSKGVRSVSFDRFEFEKAGRAALKNKIIAESKRPKPTFGDAMARMGQGFTP